MKKITLLCMLIVASFGFSQEDCASVVDLGTLTSPYMGDTTGAINDFGQDCLTNTGAPDQVFSILVPAGSTLNIGQTANNYDSKARLAYGAACPGDMLVDCNDDPDIETISWANDTGADQTAYWTQSAYSTGSGTFTLEWAVIACAAPTATATVVEDCANAQFSIDVDVTGLGNASTVTISNDAGVAATTGVAAIGMVTVGPFTAGSGVNITVEHDGDSDCNLDLGSFIDACPPSNDECMGAIAVACDDVISSTTASASDSGAGNASNDLWYSYSGPAGDITASTCTLGYDTALFVYSDCGTTLITSNDDSCGTQSSVTFTADGTSTYYILVDGYGGFSSGAFELTIACAAAIAAPANDECMAAEALVFATPSSGTTAGATENVAEEKPTCDIFGAIADVWYTVEITGGTSDLTLVTTPTGTSDQANVAVYSACGGLQADSLGCDDLGEAAGESLTVAGLANGTYYVRVWSDGTAARNSQRVEGGFDIVADATLSTQDINANGLEFTYYPNPVNDNLALKAQKDIENVSVYNMLGQEVLRTVPNAVNTEVNMSALQSGAYFVKVTIGNATETVRVLKN